MGELGEKALTAIGFAKSERPTEATATARASQIEQLLRLAWLCTAPVYCMFACMVCYAGVTILASYIAFVSVVPSLIRVMIWCTLV